MGWVVIPKLNVSSLEGINSRCRRFDLLLFRRFYAILRRYGRSSPQLGVRRFDVSLAIDYELQPHSWIQNTITEEEETLFDRIPR